MHAQARQVIRIVVVLAMAALLAAAGRAHAAAPAGVAAEGFVGSAACAECHREAYARWQASQHARAMQPATEATVRGDFNGARLRHGAVESRFFRRDGRFIARTEGPDGRLADFELAYTFGVEPLQQYLVHAPRGRLQALSLAWDARPRAQGGGRWFALYPGEVLDHRDELHWTRRHQNWNFMCADCHAVNVRRGYEAATDTFATTWSELSVGCEACHGPGATHLAWARARGTDPAMGLTITFDKTRARRWTIDPTQGRPIAASPPPAGDAELQACAPCHSRRTQLAEGWRAGGALLDHYRPALISPGLYHPDGQQRDEVYTWGSFLQSRMHQQGVTCADCHEPHGGKLRREGNALCGGCHAAARYDAPAHHRHAGNGPGTRCVACHMPTTTYMGIDARHDHSLRVPRPDLAAATGAPDACTGCHRDRPAGWAAQAVQRWLGRPAQGLQRFGPAFARAWRGQAGGLQALAEVAADASQPGIARASALAGLAGAGTAAGLAQAHRATGSDDALQRLAAIAVLAEGPPAARWRTLSPLLSDARRAIRIEAAGALADLPQADADPAFRRAAAELEAAHRLMADRPEARVALGAFLARRGQLERARAEYDAALVLDPAFVPAAVNLADLHRLQQRDDLAEAVLRRVLAPPRAPGSSGPSGPSGQPDQPGLSGKPGQPDPSGKPGQPGPSGPSGPGPDARLAPVHQALGLVLTRRNRPAEALASLARAARLAPDDARAAWLHALALNGQGRRADALREVDRGLTRHAEDRALLLAAATLRRDAGDRAGAARHAQRLEQRDPGDALARQLLAELGAAAGGAPRR